MKAFSLELSRRRVVKLLVGFAAIAFVIRMIMGLLDQGPLLGISSGGFQTFVYVAIAAAAVLLLWDIRDRFVAR